MTRNQFNRLHEAENRKLTNATKTKLLLLLYAVSW